jgi:predicted RNase H-like HicB family nuclease
LARVPAHYSRFTRTERAPRTCTHCAACEKLQVMGEPVMPKGKRTIFISYKLKAGVYLEDASGVYVSCCPALDLVSQGETHDEARRAINEAATMYLHHCKARGILDDILDGLGFEPATDEDDVEEDDEFVDVRELSDFEVFDIEVPLHLIASKGGAEACLS